MKKKRTADIKKSKKTAFFSTLFEKKIGCSLFSWKSERDIVQGGCTTLATGFLKKKITATALSNRFPKKNNCYRMIHTS